MARRTPRPSVVALLPLLTMIVLSAGQVPTSWAADLEQEARPEVGVELSVADLAREQQIPLSEAERRLGWQTLLPSLDARARDLLGERFGGVWVDPDDGDRVKVGVVDPDLVRGAGTARQLAQLAVEAAGLGAAADVVGVGNSYEALEGASDWLGRELERVNVGASWPLASSFSPSRNRVFLDLPASGELTAEQQRVVDSARQRYGAMLELRSYERPPVAAACRYPYCDKPLRAGIRILGPGGCTGGFLARSRSDNRLYQFTAGHCVYDRGGTWGTYWPGGSWHDIGPRHNWEFSGAGDAAILRVTNPSGWSARAWVNVTSSPYTTPNSEYRIQRDGASSDGQRVCATGSYFGRSDCGYVLELGATRTYLGRTVRGLALSNICGVPGDSGAPVFNYGTAHGILVGGDFPAGGSVCSPAGLVFYQGILGAENLMNVNVSHEQP